MSEQSYDPVETMTAADVRSAEHFARAKLLRASSSVLDLVSRQIARKEHDEADLFGDHTISLDLREILDITERTSWEEAEALVTQGAQAVFSAAEFEAGVGKAAKDTAGFIHDHHLENDAAAPAPFPGAS